MLSGLSPEKVNPETVLVIGVMSPSLVGNFVLSVRLFLDVVIFDPLLATGIDCHNS